MRILLNKNWAFIFLGVLIFSSCSKEPARVVPYRQIPPVPPLPLKEYFWDKSWQKTAAGYEMKIQTPSLTDSAVNKGVNVQVAIYSGWSTFSRIPLTLSDIDLPDTVNLSYTATRGQLMVFAKAHFNITWNSDIMIIYP